MSGININSEAWCRKAYLNYHCYENSMGLSARDMAKITQRWSDRIGSWQNSVSSDENEYDFDDSDYANYKESGEAAAREETDDYSKEGDMAKSISTDGVVAGAIITGIIAAVKTAGIATKNAKVPVIGWVAAGIQAALIALYWSTRPNKEGNEAANEMNNVLANAQGTLAETQGEMETMSEELITLSDEANEMNEATNEEMKEDKTELDLYMQTIKILEQKIKSGVPLTEGEKSQYKELIKLVGELGTGINETSEENTEVVEEIYGNMETYQEGYDYAAETMGEVEGMTEYAASFDTATRADANVLGGLMTANGALCGTLAGILFADLNIFTKAISVGAGVVATGAAVSSGLAAKEQFEIAKNVGNEIDTREATQELNTETNEMYTEEIDVYDGLMTGVEDLEMEVPEEIEAPEAMTVPAGGGGEGTGGAGATGGTGGATTGSSTGGTGGADDPKKKPEE